MTRIPVRKPTFCNKNVNIYMSLDYTLASPAFTVKSKTLMTCVVAIVLTTLVVLVTVMSKPTQEPYRRMTLEERLKMQ